MKWFQKVKDFGDFEVEMDDWPGQVSNLANKNICEKVRNQAFALTDRESREN